MAQLKINHPYTQSTYPGEYIPAPLKPGELLDELQKPREGESRPLVNIVESPDVFTIEVAAPGLKSGDFLVSTNVNILTISVLHKETGTGKKLYHQHEFNYCCFQREIVLPGNTDSDFISAVYTDGILVVSVPKSKEHFKHTVDRIIVY